MNIENALTRYKGYGTNFKLFGRDIQLPETSLINSIVGPRRAGKTFLMLLCKNTIKVPEGNKIYINCEDIDFEGIQASDLDKVEEAMLRIYKPDLKLSIYLFIDEVQKFPSWDSWIRTLFDEHSYKITISGSSSELSTERMSSALRGRAINTLVMPFSFKEYCNVKGIKQEKYMKSTQSAALVSGLEEYIDYGGYPTVIEAANKELKVLILQELYTTVLQRDIIEKCGIKNQGTLRAFINAASGSACRQLAIPNLVEWFRSQKMELALQTAHNYVEAARNVFLFFLIYPYSKKPKERNTKPKLYLPDPGLLEIVGADRSKKLENAVFVELLRRGRQIYYYGKDQEVDFVIASRKVDKLIQVAYSINDPETFAKETTALFKASEALGCNDLTIITFNEERKISLGAKRIKVIPAWKWLLEKE